MKKRFIEKLKKYKGDEYTLEGDYTPKGKLKLRHKVCNNIWEVLGNNVFKRNCSFCNKYNKSSICSKFERLLIENNTCFKTEVTFEGCRDRQKLPFDYGIYDCNDNLLFLVEIDGEQHFKETGYTKGGLEAVKRRDNIKNNFCKNIGVVLYRIPYNKEDKIINIFDDIMKNIVGCCENNYLGYISKSIITQQLAESIRIEYLKEDNSIRKLTKIFNISQPTIAKVIYYQYFPEIRLDIKEAVLRKARNMKPKSRKIKDLTEYEIEEAKNMKQQRMSYTHIGKRFNVCRKELKKLISDFDIGFDSTKGIPHRLTDKTSGEIWEAMSLTKLGDISPVKYNTLCKIKNNTASKKTLNKYKIEIIVNKQLKDL